MSRLRRFARSLVSGYLLLGTNVLFTLGSVPLALHYLNKTEFGLWALTMQISGYIVLIDFGMSGAVSRILVDHKDQQSNGAYGSVIQTAVLVGAAQGLIILLAGSGLSLLAARWLHVTPALAVDFSRLLVGQSVLLAASFGSRIFVLMLAAHQRFDVTNHGQALAFAANFAALWVSFSHGAGVYSLLFGNFLAWATSTVWAASGCLRLKLMPISGHWGRPTKSMFNELFRFGRDMFLFSLGGQLVSASQAILLTRWLGLDAAALWSVCSRGYMLLTQTIFRIFDYSTSALAEMMVRAERNRLAIRFRNIAVMSANLSVLAGVMFAVCNGPFVRLWTADKMEWSPLNNWLLAFWLVVVVCVHAHTGMVGQTKEFRFLRWIYFLEGMTFVGLSLELTRIGGVTGMLAASLACSLIFTLPYGLYRTMNLFGLRWSEMVRWHRGTLRMAALLIPSGLVAQLATTGLTPWARLSVVGTSIGGIGLWAFVRYGLESTMQADLVRQVPAPFRTILTRFLRREDVRL